MAHDYVGAPPILPRGHGFWGRWDHSASGNSGDQPSHPATQTLAPKERMGRKHHTQQHGIRAVSYTHLTLPTICSV
eukprot:5448827-Karenia_brevis.AAC.1